ncbi:MAG: fibronectin type III domain-containing protein [Ruminiclostridium sp.]|nr:fibronectin type III domain-containing protein [Ruminiclostridium sp.]
MRLLKKTAALILAAAISVTPAAVTGSAAGVQSGSGYAELALGASSKPAKTTLTVTSGRLGYNFSWKKVSGVKGYEIYCSDDGGTLFERIASVSSGKTSATVKNLDISKKYIFRIRSYKVSSGKKVYSSFSNSVTVRPVTEASAVTLGKPSESNTALSAASKQINLFTVPVSKINSSLAYVTDYLGQDLYVIKESNSSKKHIYQITKSALRSYNTTGKLKADKIKLDSSLDGVEWDVSVSQLDSCGSVLLRYIGKGGVKYATMQFDKSSKSFKLVHTSEHEKTNLTGDGYTFECYWTDKTVGARELKDAHVDIYYPDGRSYKNISYEEDNYVSLFSYQRGDDGVWYSFSNNINNKIRWIDKGKIDEMKISGMPMMHSGDEQYLVYYPSNTSKRYDISVSEYILLLMDSGKSYKFSGFDVVTVDADRDYDLSRFGTIKGTKTVAYYDAKNGTDKAALMDLSSGKLLTPVYDDMQYDKASGAYVAYMDKSGVWYYNKNGKKLAKFDNGSGFTKDGYALISIGKQLCFVDTKFRRVSENLKFTQSKGWESCIGAEGIMTYRSGGTGYFVVYA